MLDVTFTANARVAGSRQAPSLEDHEHKPSGNSQFTMLYPSGNSGFGAGPGYTVNGAMQTGAMTAKGGAETRPVNTAYHPRIHA